MLFPLEICDCNCPILFTCKAADGNFVIFANVVFLVCFHNSSGYWWIGSTVQAINEMVFRKRIRASTKRIVPIRISARKCGQTASIPHPRYKIVWARATKWVVGAACITIWIKTGMLSRGVTLPESICKGSNTNIINRPN